MIYDILELLNQTEHSAMMTEGNTEISNTIMDPVYGYKRHSSSYHRPVTSVAIVVDDKPFK